MAAAKGPAEKRQSFLPHPHPTATCWEDRCVLDDPARWNEKVTSMTTSYVNFLREGIPCPKAGCGMWLPQESRRANVLPWAPGGSARRGGGGRAGAAAAEEIIDLTIDEDAPVVRASAMGGGGGGRRGD